MTERWYNVDPAPRWVALLARTLIVAMIVGVIAYGFWSYR